MAEFINKLERPREGIGTAKKTRIMAWQGAGGRHWNNHRQEIWASKAELIVMTDKYNLALKAVGIPEIKTSSEDPLQ